ncbi:uncharacterized protein [Epargyreus clarus]|uniref:uncharacterized protein n=1 Tax=Epargyreus clarus TaxID=520877 RepID=UPI003C2BAF7E
MARLEQLSISFNVGLKSLQLGTFDGLINLRNLTLVNNGFTNISHLASLLKPNILPSLKGLDVSENRFGNISKDDFSSMKGSLLSRLEINLCNLEYVHPDSFLSLQMLKDLYIGQNNLNETLLSNLLTRMYINNNINLTFLDLSGMGFRKQPPRKLMETIAMTTISRLILADNHFERIFDDTFPTMANIKELDLRRVFALNFGADAFDTIKFPNLQVLLLSGNNLHGLHQTNRPSSSLLVLDLAYNGDFTSDKYYYDIGRNTFVNFKKLRVLYLAYNPIRSIYDYTFTGLEDLRILNLDNSTVYFAEEGSFKPLKRLELLNLANNPLGQVVNLTGSIFDGLGHLKVLDLKNCRISYFKESDNLFKKMPNITTLVLRKNLLRYITAEILKPLTKLEILDLRDNMLGTWWKPLFLTYGVRPTIIYVGRNKITHFTVNMLMDINYLLENPSNVSIVMDFTNNVFVCDCNSMYETYIWLKVNGSRLVNKFFYNSNFQCNSPDVWENKRVALFLEAVSNLRCSVYIEASNVILLVWSAPTLVTIILWCRWETHLAECHRLFLEDGTTYDPLVLIKIGDIEKKNLTITLKYLLRSKIYHSWNGQETEEFWVKLKKVLMKK